MRKTTRGRRSAALVCASLAISVSLAAQEAHESPFGETVDVRLVNIEVWVTDGKGDRLPGLTADDFRVFEDGRRVRITHFAEVEGNQAVVSTSDPQPRETETASSATPTPVIEPGHLVLYFDHLHLSPVNRPRIIKDVRRFLQAEKIPADRVLILSQTRDLETEVPFGSSWEELDLALTRLSEAGIGGAPWATQKRMALDELQRTWEQAKNLGGSSGGSGGGIDTTCDAFVGRAESKVLELERVGRSHIYTTLDHLAAVTGFLNGLSGVKTLLYISDSLERQPGAALAKFVFNLCPSTPVPRLSGLGQDLTVSFSRLTHANANRVTIYALQTTGLQTSFTGGAEQRSVEYRALGGFDYAIRETERAGMTLLADQTGGRTIYNQNRFGGALDEIVGEMANYYSLAYVPEHATDLAEHRIRVEVDTPGTKSTARYRRSYQDKSSDTKMAERLHGAVFLGLLENPLGVRLGAGDVEAVDSRLVTLPLHVMIPIENLVFLPGDDGPIARLRLLIKTQDTKTQKGILEYKTLTVDRPPEDQSLLSVELDLRLPQGAHLIAAGVRDEATRQASYVSTTVELSANDPRL